MEISFNRFTAQPKEVIHDPSGIFKALLKSQGNGTVIGIVSPNLGHGMILTGVEDLILKDEGCIVVVLKKYDINGRMLPSNEILLSDVLSVCPFNSQFQNPFVPKENDGEQNYADFRS